MPDVPAENLPTNDSPSDERPLIVNDLGGTPVVQLGPPAVAKAGDTMTGDLVIDKNNPFVDLFDNNGTDGLARVRLLSNLDSFYISARLNNGGLNVNLARFTDQGVAIPSPSTAGMAAQVTAIDATTGRLQIGGHEIGDTGWRNIALANGWTAAQARLRRTGDIVSLELGTLNGDSATNAIFMNWSAFPGFATSSEYRTVLHHADQIPTTVERIYSVASGLRAANAGQYPLTLFGSISWATTDAWPVSLPGVAA